MDESRSRHESGELIIGLVGPVGSDLEKVERALAEALDERAYECTSHRLSEWFEIGPPFPEIDHSSEYTRIESAMDAGDRIREFSGRADIMAIHAASRIAQSRESSDGSSRWAHILRSLKRPEEVEYLRGLYGPRFILISAYVSRRRRVTHLMSMGMSESSAFELVGRDENADSKFGQATAKTFELADLFVNADLGVPTLVEEIGRFTDLALGSPLVTPRKEEHAMFLAYASSLRSGDLSRQVGAVITTDDGTLLAEGANDAPRFGGGRQWPGAQDRRDIALGYDSNARIVGRMVDQILAALSQSDGQWSASDRARVANLLAPSGVLDITEFGRAVHAEMDALMACARLGISAHGQVMYCTTFPCHNCAKHLLAAGIQQVWFIEPYPKSRALELHSDAVTDCDECEKMMLTPFVGVGPRRYVDWFALRDAHGARVRRKDGEGGVVRWNGKTAMPLLHDRRMNYLDLESKSAAEVDTILELARQALGAAQQDA